MPWLLGVFGIVVAFGVSWLADIISTFQHLPGLSGRGRALRFFSIADVDWALALLLAALLLAVGTRVLSPPSQALGARVHQARQGVALASAVLVVAAVISLILNLSLADQDIDAAITAAISDLAVAIVGAAAGLWAWRSTKAGSPG